MYHLLAVFAAVCCFAINLCAQADVVVINADVRTMSEKTPRAEAFAVIGGKISAVGTTKTISAFIDERTVVIDAKGRVVIPGFNDAHVHFMPLGNTFSSTDISRFASKEAVFERLRVVSDVLPKGRWLRGSGWDPERISAAEIASAVGDRPLFIYSSDALSAVVNEAALRLAGSKNADGFVVTGAEMAAVRAQIPRDHSRNYAELAQTATNFAASKGVTSLTDTNADDHRSVYRLLAENGELKTRIYDCVSLRKWRTVIERTDTEMVRGGCLKDFFEPSESERAEWLRDEIAAADKAGLQVLVHAIGGAANGVVLDIFADVIEKNGGSKDRRFRIEHAYGVRDEDTERFAKMGVIASFQPHLFRSSAGLREFFDAGVTVAFGSDAAMTELDPMLGVHAAVNSGNDISVEQAVRAYTAGSAFAEFTEERKGTLGVGMLADFVILSKDIFSIEKASIKDAKVLLTAVGGRIVYKHQELK